MNCPTCDRAIDPSSTNWNVLFDGKTYCDFGCLYETAHYAPETYQRLKAWEREGGAQAPEPEPEPATEICLVCKREFPEAETIPFDRLTGDSICIACAQRRARRVWGRGE